jgi:diguanylate cyclase
VCCITESEQLLSDLFINSVILIAVLSIGTQIFRERPLTAKKSLLAQILAGALIGVLGCILMRYSVRVNPKVMLDFRNIPIIFASVFSGFIPSVTAGAVIGIFRVLYFGISNASIAALLIALVIGVGCGLICRPSLSNARKWVYCVIYSLIVATIGISINIKETTILIYALVYYWIAFILMSIFIYFYIQYLYQSGELYRRYRDEFRRDFLTGLNNVRQFDKVFNERINQVKTSDNKSLSLLYIDIDLFKSINDTYGHTEGDLVLKEFSNILVNTCKGKDLVFRNGGEEFSVILNNYSAQDAVDVAERIRIAVQAHTFRLSNGRKISITASIGVSSYPDTTKDINMLLEEADTALYTAKRSGRNKTVLSDENQIFS